MNNRLTELLRIEHPVILGGMMKWGGAALAAEVSRAGGLGVLGAATMSPQELASQIAQVRSLTARPFGVNISLMPHREAEALAETAVSESVPVVSTSAGNPFRLTPFLKDHCVLVLHVVSSVSQARKAEAAGVDAVIAEGGESGGFLGKDQVSTFALTPQVVDAVNIPVISAGGIADGRGLAAALALGAQGVQMGTRFLATDECVLPADYQKALLLARDTDTVAVIVAGRFKRQLKMEALLKARGQSDQSRQDPEEGSGYSAGQGAGLIREILPAGDIVRATVAHASEVLARLNLSISRGV